MKESLVWWKLILQSWLAFISRETGGLLRALQSERTSCVALSRLHLSDLQFSQTQLRSIRVPVLRALRSYSSVKDMQKWLQFLVNCQPTMWWSCKKKKKSLSEKSVDRIMFQEWTVVNPSEPFWKMKTSFKMYTDRLFWLEGGKARSNWRSHPWEDEKGKHFWQAAVLKRRQIWSVLFHRWDCDHY